MGRLFRRGHEVCLIFMRGNVTPDLLLNRTVDVIFDKPTATGTKPFELYQRIKALWPDAKYLEIFGRLHNLRANWTLIGYPLKTKNSYRPW